MTERKKYMLQVMEYCVLHGEFCDQCLNKDGDYESCHALHAEFISEARKSWEKEDEQE